jgi:hypothetical protein
MRAKIYVCVLQVLTMWLAETGFAMHGPCDIARSARTARRNYKATASRRLPRLWESGQCAVKFMPAVTFSRYGTIEHLFRCFEQEDRDGHFVMVALVLPWGSADGFPLPRMVMPSDEETQLELVRVEMICTSTVLFLPAIPLDLLDGWTHNVVNLDP